MGGGTPRRVLEFGIPFGMRPAGVGGAGVDQVGPHAILGAFGGHGADQPQQPGFGGGYHGGVGPPGDGRLPAQADDAAGTPLNHPRQYAADEVKSGVQVGSDDLLPLGNGHFQQRLVRAHRHIADQHIHWAQGGDALGYHSGYPVGVGHVADDSMGADAQRAAFGGHGLQFGGGLAGVEDQVGALAGESAGDFGANVAAGAGNQGGFVLQTHISCSGVVMVW